MSAGMLLHNIGKIMIIFDQNCTKIFTLIKITPVYDQLSDIILGTSTGPKETENGELQRTQRRAPEQTMVWKYALKCQELYLLYWTTFKRLLNQNL